MGKGLLVAIEPCEYLPEGGILDVESWRIRDNMTAYYAEGTQTSHGSIPKDSLLVLEQAIEGQISVKARLMVGTWSLNYGIHNGTLMSRDSDTSHGYQSLEAVQAHYAESMRNVQGFGYMCWFAYAVPPEGDRIEIDTPRPYR